MKTYFTRTVLFATIMCAALSGFSQLSENFNSRSSIAVNQVKSYLQNNCWQFPGFVVGNGASVIEGDGSLFSDASSQQVQNAGIYTPVLNLQGTTDISFTYSFSKEATYSRWIKLCVASTSNQLIQVLDSMEIKNTAANITYTFKKSVQAGTGIKRIYILYIDDAKTTSIAIDQLQISASQHYATGCNQAPVAVPDAFSAGATNGIVTGNVMQNDKDPDGDAMSAYLISGSADGTVNLLTNGYFTFTPAGGFHGTSTIFTYKVCDAGYGQLCSSTATVTIFFSPGSILPVRYVDCNAAYNNGFVALNWTTAYENSTEQFDIERGSDSIHFQKLTTIKGYGTLGSINFYKYSDAQSPETDLLKILYYRIKSTDVNGKVVYSPVIRVNIEGISGLRSVKVSPNPVINDIALNLQLNRTCEVTVKVMSSTGSVVFSQLMQGEAGMNYIKLNGTSQLQKGLYFVQVLIGKDEKLMSKIIKN